MLAHTFRQFLPRDTAQGTTGLIKCERRPTRAWSQEPTVGWRSRVLAFAGARTLPVKVLPPTSTERVRQRAEPRAPATERLQAPARRTASAGASNRERWHVETRAQARRTASDSARVFAL